MAVAFTTQGQWIFTEDPSHINNITPVNLGAVTNITREKRIVDGIEYHIVNFYLNTATKSDASHGGRQDQVEWFFTDVTIVDDFFTQFAAFISIDGISWPSPTYSSGGQWIYTADLAYMGEIVPVNLDNVTHITRKVKQSGGITHYIINFLLNTAIKADGSTTGRQAEIEWSFTDITIVDDFFTNFAQFIAIDGIAWTGPTPPVGSVGLPAVLAVNNTTNDIRIKSTDSTSYLDLINGTYVDLHAQAVGVSSARLYLDGINSVFSYSDIGSGDSGNITIAGPLFSMEHSTAITSTAPSVFLKSTNLSSSVEANNSYTKMAYTDGATCDHKLDMNASELFLSFFDLSLGKAGNVYITSAYTEIVHDDEIRLNSLKIGMYGVAPVARSAAYTITNVTTDRVYDANSTTLDEIADVLGTLITDLKLLGAIG